MWTIIYDDLEKLKETTHCNGERKQHVPDISMLNYVPYVLTGQYILCAYVLTYPRVLRAYMPTCLAHIRVHVAKRLACSRVHVPTCFACLHALCASWANMATCLVCSRTESICSFFIYFVFLKWSCSFVMSCIGMRNAYLLKTKPEEYQEMS